jgi:hypothetical protein
MKKGVRLITGFIVFAGLLTGISGCAVGPDNVKFTVRLSGPVGAEFRGSCTYEVKDLIGSRTEEAQIQEVFTEDKTTLEYTIAGTEISGKINNLTPEKPITIVLLKDGEEVRRIDALGEGEAYLAWYPPIIVNTKAQEPRGYRYETEGDTGNIRETAFFTAEETAKITSLVEKIPPDTKRQFEEKVQALMTELDDPVYQVRSDPYWTTTEQYKQLLQFCREQGEKVWPLIFQHLDNEGTLEVFVYGSLLVDVSIDKYPDILARIRLEEQHGRYTEDGLYILPYTASTMRLAKELLAIL